MFVPKNNYCILCNTTMQENFNFFSFVFFNEFGFRILFFSIYKNNCYLFFDKIKNLKK